MKRNASEPRVERSTLTVIDAAENDKDLNRYWWSKTPLERLAAVETHRRVVYGYTDVTPRLQRVLEIAGR
jgi:hypothetical protein